MATSMTSMNVMLAIHGKKTAPLDMYKPLRQYILSHYSEREAADGEDDLQSVQSMRTAVEKQLDALEPRRDLLQRYFRTLTVMETRFPISPERDHVNSLHFVWFDAFKAGKKASQQNIHFEKAGVIFNLAAVQSQLGLAADRSSAAGLKQACNCFQAAAGCFAFLRDNVSMKASAGGIGSSTVDISVECAGMLERLMLAQAQECFYEKVLADGKPSTLCGRVARQVGMYYEEAHAALTLPPLNLHFDRTWVSHVQLKSSQFQAESLFRVSLDLHEQDNIAEEIARLQGAMAMLGEAKKSGKGAVGPLWDAVIKLEGSVARNLERAKKENDRVYLMKVPAYESLPGIPPANLVSATSQQEVLDASKEKMFPGLVPDSSAKALSKYTEMVDDIIRTQTEKLQNESDLTRVKLQEMELPESMAALQGSGSIPDQLQEDVEAVKIDGGPGGLDGLMLQLKDLRRVNEELLVQTEELLDKEAREDAQIRAQFGTRWTRPASSTLTKNLHDRANGFAANLRQAGESDSRIERSLKDNEQLLAILKAQPIEAALPKLSKPIVSVHGDEDAITSRLKQLLTELEKLGSQRAGLEDMLKDMKRKDNILPQLMNTAGSYDDLFKREVAKYDPICQQVDRNIKEQEKLLQEIKTQSEAFAAAFNLQEHNAAREKVLKQITAAVAKYREIRENMNEGLKFYVTLQDAITNLKQQCGDYVMTRSIQCREMMEDLQRSMAGLSVADSHSQSRTYPPPPQPSPEPGRQGPGGIFQHFSMFAQRNNQPQPQPQPPPPSASHPPQQVHPPPYYASMPENPPPSYQQQQQQQAPPPAYASHPPQYAHSSYYGQQPPAAPPQAGGYGSYTSPPPPPQYYQGPPGSMQTAPPNAQYQAPYQGPGGYYRQG